MVVSNCYQKFSKILNYYSKWNQLQKVIKKIKIIFIIYFNNLYSVCFDRSSTLQDMQLKIIVFFLFLLFYYSMFNIFSSISQFYVLLAAFNNLSHVNL